MTNTTVTVTATQNGETPAAFVLTTEAMTGMYFRDLDAIKRAAREQLPAGFTLWAVVDAPKVK